MKRLDLSNYTGYPAGIETRERAHHFTYRGGTKEMTAMALDSKESSGSLDQLLPEVTLAKGFFI